MMEFLGCDSNNVGFVGGNVGMKVDVNSKKVQVRVPHSLG